MRPRIDDVAFAVDEHIWGHRLYDEQLPHLTFLEFLGVLLSNRAAPLEEPAGQRLRYCPQRQIRLRSLLFNNPHVEAVRARTAADADKWKVWEECFLQEATGKGDGDLEHLTEAFVSFEDFARALDLLRSSAYEATSNKRWSSKFVYPYGPDALYEDLRVDAQGNASNDRRFFARTGEILYLILCRSSQASQLGRLLVERLFDAKASLNRLVQVLQGEPQSSPGSREVGYLPYPHLPRFDQLAKDWLTILSRDMPVSDVVDHLIASAGLNLLLYFLEQGKAAAGDTDPIEIICEIVSRDRSKIRTLSADSWQANQALSLRAVRASIESIRYSSEWEAALGSEEPQQNCTELLRAWFQWPEDKAVDGVHQDQLIETLIEEAESRHGQHFGKIHSAWSRAIGLSSRRLSRRMRYAPNDRLLKTLVVTIVEGRMEFGEFLRELLRRYGLVIGEAEGGRLLRENLLDQETLSDNAARLEERLLGLGLLRRLSDSCSFVENPFFMEKPVDVR